MACTSPHLYDVLVVGGGIVGSAVAFGLQKAGLRTALLDASPGQQGIDKASRGNMGLIWCQSKFAHFPAYARLGFTASELYREFVQEIEECSGISVGYRPSGGLIPCVGEEEQERRSAYLDTLRLALGADYPARMIDLQELQERLPRVSFGPQVCGAVWCEKDGYIDPLKLLYGLRKAYQSLGGRLYADSRVSALSAHEGACSITIAGTKKLQADKLVLAAGLSNKKLCADMDCCLPLYADRSQVMLTERIDDILPIPLLGITRTPGGTVMIGAMRERAGFDTRVIPQTLVSEACWAMRVWPDLGRLRIIRTWSGLRVMPEDGQPIYDTVPGCSGLYILAAHSGVTLAPVHAGLIPSWIAGGAALPDALAAFSLKRFRSAGESVC